jgi:hypothetical protein
MKKTIFYLLLCLAWLVSFLSAADLRPPLAAQEALAPGALAAQMQEAGYVFERTVTFPSSSHFYFSIFRVAAGAR